MNRLEIEQHRITDDIEYFGHLEPFKSNGLPSNSIIFKKLPGFGATYWEICYKERNSIIIEPHVPVIIGKQTKHPEILGVYKGIKQSDIKDYLNNSIYPKKIVTTPEGYMTKVKPVIEADNNFNLYKDFFMLFDECDRLITDVKYRGQIIAPIDDFFLFDTKAMISATVIFPSDSRFKEQNFKIVKIVPDYDYKKDLALISSNNIVASVRNEFAKESENPVFIFLNSTLTIYAIISLLEIEADSKVFCAEDSVAALKLLKFNNASTELHSFAKYNFCTSRFFSAVDIDLDYKPDVIMITDVYQARHSTLDPMTEVIQISGRFRKQAGSRDKTTTNSLTHITNYNAHIQHKTQEEAIAHIKGNYDAHCKMIKNRDEAINSSEKDAHDQGAKRSDANEFFKEDGTLNHFIVDNYMHEQRIRSYYSSHESLNDAYLDSKYFNLAHTIFSHPINDQDNMKLALAKTGKQRNEAITDLLVKHSFTSHSSTIFRFYDAELEIDKLRSKYSNVVEAFFLLGYEEMKKADFKMHKIKKLSDQKKIENGSLDPQIVKAIYEAFGIGDVIPEKETLSRINEIYKRFNYNPKKVFAQNITRYFKVARTESKKGVKVFRILNKLIDL